MMGSLIDSNQFEYDLNSNTVAEEAELAREERDRAQETLIRGRGTKRGRGGRGKSSSPAIRIVKERTNTNKEKIPGVGKRTSWVWREFNLTSVTNSETKVKTVHAICRHCHDTFLNASGRNGTSKFKRHLDGCQSYIAWKNEIAERVVSDGESELKIYLNAPLFKAAADFDILIWWRDYSKDYPILAKIARDILAIPITTVASESSFSMGSRILYNWRASLTNEHAEAFITSRNWLFGYEHTFEDDVSHDDTAPDAESHAEEGDDL